ncbi:MAG TPA: tetratricopeptide repeat protein [Candidatus Obscuribacterales bacterium]
MEGNTVIQEKVWQTYIDMGISAARAGREDVAEQMLDAAMEFARSLPRSRPDTADKLYTLACVNGSQRRIRRALTLHKEALAIYDQTLEPDDPRILRVLNALSEIYMAYGKPEKAEVHLERAAHYDENRLGYEERLILVDVLIKLALLSYNQHRYSESAKHYLRAETIRQNLNKCA